MNDAPDDSLDTLLRQHWQAATEPDDAGFSLRVMARLPQRGRRRRRAARWLRHAQWAAVSLTACSAAALLSGEAGELDLARAAAAAVMLGLMIFWSVPGRWNRW